jgi:hypothetical protein
MQGMKGARAMNKTETAQHTPTPWDIVQFDDEDKPIIIGPNGDERIAVMQGNEPSEANAQHIVHCVNLHDELVQALETGLEFWNDEDGDNLSEWREQAKQVLAKTKKDPL